MSAAFRLQTTLAHLQPTNNAAPAQQISAEDVSGGVDINRNSAKFAYTVDSNILSPEQRQFYEDNGFLVIKGLLPADDIERYTKRYISICEGDVEPALGMQLVRDISLSKLKDVRGVANITKIQNYEEDEVLFDYCKHPKVLEYVKGIVGENVKSVHTMFIAKANEGGSANSTGRHPLHQDLHYFPFRPVNKICASWTALEKITRQNGCLVVLAGSHKGKLLEHDYPEWEGGVNKAYHGAKGLNKDEIEKRIYLEMEAGDTVFFHPLLIHGSGANRSTGFRKAISTHYASSDCFYIDVKGTSQEYIAKEVEDIAMKKYGLDPKEFDFTMIWKAKSRLVAGMEGSL